MAREAESVTAERRELGSRLATFRKAERKTQTQLGKALHYERTSITHIEGGSQPAPRTFWTHADEVLNAHGALIAAFDEFERVRVAERQEVATQQYDETVALADRWRSAGVAEPVVERVERPADVLDSAIWAWQHPASPDAEVPQAGAAVLHWLVDSVHRVNGVGRESGWRGIGRNDVRRVQIARDRLKTMDNSLGGGAALPMALVYLRREVPPLLEGRYDGATGQALIGVVAELALDVGWMAYDAGNQPEARRQLLYALRLAGIADDRLFGGRAACAMSHQALHLGRTQEAVDLAIAARTNTSRLAGPTARAMFQAMEACALASTGARRECFESLAAAESAIEKSRPGDDRPAWLDFDDGGVAGHAARAMCALGRGNEAQRFARYAIENCLDGHTRTRAQREALLASALYQGGDTDQAAAVGEHLIEQAWCLDSEHVRQQVIRLSRDMAKTRSTSVALFLNRAQDLLQSRPPSHSLTTT